MLPVATIARLVGVRPLDEEDQLVTHVAMRGQRRARLEAGQDRPALARLVLPDPLLAHARPRLDPRQIVEREHFRGRRAAALRGRLHAAGEDRQHRRPVLGRDGVDTAVGPIAHVPRGDGAEVVADGALDDEDQLVADVPVPGKLRARLDAGQDGLSLGRRILPQALSLDARLPILPWKIADRDDSRHRLHRRHGGLLIWPSVSRLRREP